MTKQNHATIPDQGMETRVALLEMCVSNINHTLEKIDTKMDRQYDEINKRMDRMDSKFDRMDDKFDKMHDKMEKGFDELRGEMKGMKNEMNSDFKWLLGLIIGSFASLSGIMARGFHWF